MSESSSIQIRTSSDGFGRNEFQKKVK